MTDEEIQAALGSLPKPADPPMKTAPIGELLGCSDAHAATYARAKGLIDADNRLHCWNCHQVTDWHVSLHCPACRVESRVRAPERRRIERETAMATKQREQARPVAAPRSFRDGY